MKSLESWRAAREAGEKALAGFLRKCLQVHGPQLDAMLSAWKRVVNDIGGEGDTADVPDVPDASENLKLLEVAFEGYNAFKKGTHGNETQALVNLCGSLLENYAAWHTTPFQIVEQEAAMGVWCLLPPMLALLRKAVDLHSEYRVAKANSAMTAECMLAEARGEEVPKGGKMLPLLRHFHTALLNPEHPFESKSKAFSKIRVMLGRFYASVVSEVVLSVVTDLRAVAKIAHEGLAQEETQKFMTSISGTVNDKEFSNLAAFPATPTAKQVYNSWKYLDSNEEAYETMSGLPGLPTASKDIMAGWTFHKPDIHKFAAVVTVAQMLVRPLKAGESRILLCKKCKGVMERRKFWGLLPESVKQRLLAHAGSESAA